MARDLSNPTYKFLTRLNTDLFAGTPYEHDALGTKASFDATTSDMLKKFYDAWYAPNNAVLVISGDVDPQSALDKVKQLYGSIPRHAVPAHPPVTLKPVKSESFTLESNLPYTAGIRRVPHAGHRQPGLRRIARPERRAVEPARETLRSRRAR